MASPNPFHKSIMKIYVPGVIISDVANHFHAAMVSLLMTETLPTFVM